MFGDDDDCSWCGKCDHCGDHKLCRQKDRIRQEYDDVKEAIEELEKLPFKERIETLLASEKKIEQFIYSQEAGLRIAHWKSKYSSSSKSYYDEAVKRLKDGAKMEGLNVTKNSAPGGCEIKEIEI